MLVYSCQTAKKYLNTITNMALFPEKDQRLACKSVCLPARQLYCTKELEKEAEHNRESGTNSERTGRAAQGSDWTGRGVQGGEWMGRAARSMTGVPGVPRLSV